MEVDAVSGAIMNTQFANPLPHWLNVPSMTEAETIQARRYQSAYPLIFQMHSPFSESLRLFYLDHF